jgi:threonine dehydratase
MSPAPLPLPRPPLRGAALEAALPVTLADVEAAQTRIRPHLDVQPTPARTYPALDRLVGHGVRLVVKHEHMLPTGAFKVRNGLSAVTALPEAARQRGIVGASTGNHGLGLAYAGARLGCAVTIVVPRGNNPAKNQAIRDWGRRSKKPAPTTTRPSPPRAPSRTPPEPRWCTA